MKTTKYNSEDEWLDDRKGKVTGTRLKDLIVKRGTGKKIGFYELIAERVAVPHDGESYLDRGHRLEDEAILAFNEETGKKAKKDLIMWAREDNEDIAISPDAVISKEEAVEIKCLSSAKHIEAWLTKEVPDEYWYQVLQYFIVNDALTTLYMLFYDPRMPKSFFYLTINRAEVEEEVKEVYALEQQVLAEVAVIANDLTF